MSVSHLVDVTDTTKETHLPVDMYQGVPLMSDNPSLHQSVMVPATVASTRNLFPGPIPVSWWVDHVHLIIAKTDQSPQEILKTHNFNVWCPQVLRSALWGKQATRMDFRCRVGSQGIATSHSVYQSKFFIRHMIVFPLASNDHFYPYKRILLPPSRPHCRCSNESNNRTSNNSHSYITLYQISSPSFAEHTFCNTIIN
jgi:hypothetical protein